MYHILRRLGRRNMKVLLLMSLDLRLLLLLLVRPNVRRRYILVRRGYLHRVTASSPKASVVIESPLVLPVELLVLLLLVLLLLRLLGLCLGLLQVGEIVEVVGQLLTRERVRRLLLLLLLLLRWERLMVAMMSGLRRKMLLLLRMLCLRVLRLAGKRRLPLGLPLRQGACVGHDGGLMGRAVGGT